LSKLDPSSHCRCMVHWARIFSGSLRKSIEKPHFSLTLIKFSHTERQGERGRQWTFFLQTINISPVICFLYFLPCKCPALTQIAETMKMYDPRSKAYGSPKYILYVHVYVLQIYALCLLSSECLLGYWHEILLSSGSVITCFGCKLRLYVFGKGFDSIKIGICIWGTARACSLPRVYCL